MITDSIGDCLTRVRNAIMAGSEECTTRYSKINEQILNLLRDEGYLTSVMIKDDAETKGLKWLAVKIRQDRNGEALLKSLRRVSKPGHRVYRKVPEKALVRSGYGIQILTTSKGLMTDKQAIEKRVGGEVIAEFY